MIRVDPKLGISAIQSGTYGSAESLPDARAHLQSHSPIDGSLISEVELSSESDYESVVQSSLDCFLRWRTVPAPKRGELVRKVGNALRDYKAELGELISIEMGKIRSEGEGEVQEAIDVADFAVGLSRQLYGKAMHSERPGHRMYEQWHPLGPVGVITAFNFPVAVWAWNAMIAAVCGDTVIWKPSELTPLCSVATMKICTEVASAEGFPGLFTMLTDADASIGKRLAADKRIPLISATGSCRMGRAVSEVVAARFGKSILELGGNNALIVMPDADMSLAIPAITFGAVGTAGQRCTSTRRIIVHEGIADKLEHALISAYKQIRIGDPLDSNTLMGPLVRRSAVEEYHATIKEACGAGAELLYGGESLPEKGSELYVQPTLLRAQKKLEVMQKETFAPIAYIVHCKTLQEAIEIQNDVPQGLSSALFTQNLKYAEQFLSAVGSDCGIANINIGTSGAEIGGAFGGEKETGGGRESGSDSWKQYMRRQTNTINYSDALPLAQGVKFEIA